MKRKILAAASIAGATLAIATPAQAATGGCWPTDIGSSNYGSSSTWAATGGGRYWHLNMVHGSNAWESAIYLSGVKVSSGGDVTVWRSGTGSRYVHFRWGTGSQEMTVWHDCGYWSS